MWENRRNKTAVFIRYIVILPADKWSAKELFLLKLKISTLSILFEGRTVTILL